MSNYRRRFVAGGMFFFTLVTYARRPILTTTEGCLFLRAAIQKVREKRPFDLVANVLMPDHWHLVMQLPPGDGDYSTRLKRIKEEFTLSWLDADLMEAEVTRSQRTRGERGVWQPRFWEQSIDNESELDACVDYIHWNPRKHGLVARVRDYPHSSFHRFVEAGHYDLDWGGIEPDYNAKDATWGEPGSW